MVAPSSEPLACTVYLECTTGMGDLLFDAAAGVTVALERGCVLPRVRSHWQRKDRHYEWPTIVHSALFQMDAPVFVRASRGKHNTMHANGGPFTDYSPSEQLNWPLHERARQDVVVVTFPTGPFVNGTCGGHSPTQWMRPLVPHATVEHLVARYRRVLRSIHIVNSSALPPAISERAVVHFRRGDRAAEPRTAHHSDRPADRLHGANGSASSRPSYERLDTAVVRWLVRASFPCHVVTDDPGWGALFTDRLRREGLDTSFYNRSTPVDDLAAMMHSRVIVRAALAPSRFSDLASVLSGVQLVSFVHQPVRRANGTRSSAAGSGQLGARNGSAMSSTRGSSGGASSSWLATHGLINSTFIELERFSATVDRV